MLSQGRQSSRDAIRIWLEQTYEEENYDDQKHNQQIRSRQWHEQSDPQTHRQDEQTGTRIPEKIKTGIPPKEDVVHNQELSGLAKRLGLHEPFQAMERRVVCEELDIGSEKRRRNQKRKRSPSAMSYLEPAVFKDMANDGSQRSNDGNTRDIEAELFDSTKHATNTTSEVLDTPAKPDSRPVENAKTYEKRPRRKTREDRYDLKNDRRKKKSNTILVETTERKRSKRKERSGAAMSHVFTAKNVAPDRLTLKPTAKLGLFTRGRASSPVRRRGLPDLSFSEMSFLNSHREVLDRAAAGTAAKGSLLEKKKKSTQHYKEMSKFFIPNAEPLAGRCSGSLDNAENSSPQGVHSRFKQHDRNSSTVTSSLPPIELVERPFLGFGEPGPGSQSPSRSHKNSKATSGHVHRPYRRNTIDTTSYYTWSQSPIRTHASIDQIEDDDSYVKTVRKLSRKESAEINADKKQANPITQAVSNSPLITPIDVSQPQESRAIDIRLRERCDDAQPGNTTAYRPLETSHVIEIVSNASGAIDKREVPESATLMHSMEQSLQHSAMLDIAPSEALVIDQNRNTSPQETINTAPGTSFSEDPSNQPLPSILDPKKGPRKQDRPVTVHQRFSPQRQQSFIFGTSFAAMERDVAPPGLSHHPISWDVSGARNTSDSIYRQQIPTDQLRPHHRDVEVEPRLHHSRSEVSCPLNPPYGTPISLEVRSPITFDTARSPLLQIDAKLSMQCQGYSSDMHEVDFGANIPTEGLDNDIVGWSQDLNVQAQDERDHNAPDLHTPFQHYHRNHPLRQIEDYDVSACIQVPIHERTFQDYPQRNNDHQSRLQMIFEEHENDYLPSEQPLVASFTPTYLSERTTSSYTSGLRRNNPRPEDRPLSSDYIVEKYGEAPRQVDEAMLVGFWRPNKLY